ncbi:MAG: alpha/beta hydrolase [Spirochaetales bacterium]|nr:alpha/beta hydrolase [Spirochaetales bacterium]
MLTISWRHLICAVLFGWMLSTLGAQEASMGPEEVFGPYRAVQTQEEYEYYLRENRETPDLVIYLEGSGLQSVLGTKKEGRWASATFAYFLTMNFMNSASLCVPQKPGMELGMVHHDDAKVLHAYTAENLLTVYARCIDDALERESYRHVIIIGGSEGGYLLPGVYQALTHKEDVDGLVVLGAGAWNQKESLLHLSQSPLPMEEGYRQELRRIDELIPQILAQPESIEEWYLGWPYRRWSSFFEWTPQNALEGIETPMLYLQGVLDISNPMESVKAVEAMEKKNITVQYFPNMGHTPQNPQQMAEIFEAIDLWMPTLREDG